MKNSDVKIHEITFFLHVSLMRINFMKIIILSVFDRLKSMIKIENSRNIKNFIHYKNSIKNHISSYYRLSNSFRKKEIHYCFMTIIVNFKNLYDYIILRIKNSKTFIFSIIFL